MELKLKKRGLKMFKEIKLKYIWSNPTKTHFLSEIFTLDEIESGEQFMVLDNEPFFKNYRRVAILQWTGLLDKNGKEVCEDDIIHFSKYNQKHNETDQGIGIVKFDEFDYRYCLRLEDCKQIKPKPSGFFRGLGDLGSCEIIGNIYEHKYLLDNK